jgi:hypothetical protein
MILNYQQRLICNDSETELMTITNKPVCTVMDDDTSAEGTVGSAPLVPLLNFDGINA